MAFTKVVGAGIHTLSNITSHNINSSGIITATKFVGPFDGTSGTFSGNVTIGGNLSVAQTVTYEDVKNVDSVGVITARSGIKDQTLTAGRVVYVDSDKTLTDSANLTFNGNDVGIARSIFHLGNTYTSIGFPSNNQVKIFAGGVDNTTFTSSTVAFNKKLQLRSSAVIDQEVSESNASTPTLRIRNTATHTLASFQNTNTTSTIFQWNDYGSSTTAGNLIFRSSNSGNEEFARITGAGNVGIGTVNPDHKLHVYKEAGDSVISVESTGNGNHSALEFLRTSSGGNSKGAGSIYVTGDTSGSEAKMKFAVGHNVGHSYRPNMVIMGNGEVGIGTDTATAKLEISDAIGTTGEEVLLKLQGRATKNVYLDINADANRRGVIRFKSAGTDKWSIGRGDSDELSDSSFFIATGNSGGNTTKLAITSGGNVGINETTPDSKLDILHSTSTNSNTENLIHLRTDPGAGYVSRGLFIKIGRDANYDNSAAHYDIVGSSGNSGFHAFEVQGDEKLRITKDGKVGINETAPSEKLQIDGDILLGGQANSSESNYAIKFEYNNHQFAKIVGDGRDSSGYGDIDFYTSSGSGVSNLTQRMSIRANGYIGMGDFTSAIPDSMLHINGISATAQIRLQRTNAAANTNDYGRIYFESTDNVLTGEISVARESAENNGYMHFNTASGGTLYERLRIASDGQVRMNTSGDPAADLHVGGTGASLNAYFQTSRSSGAYHHYAIGQSGASLGYFGSAQQISSSGQAVGFAWRSEGHIEFCTGGSTERVRIDTIGRVMIGTSTAGLATGDEFVISTSEHTGMTIRSGNAHEGNIFFGDPDYGAAGIIRYEHNNNAMVFKTNSTGQERLRIDSSGNVKVVARGSSTSGAPFYVAVTGKSDISYAGGNDDTACLRIVDNGSNNSYYHGLEMRSRQGADVRLYCQDQGNDLSHFVIATDNSALLERARFTQYGMQLTPYTTDSANSGYPISTFTDGGTRFSTHMATHSGYSGNGEIICITSMADHTGGYEMFSVRITGYWYNNSSGGAIDCVVGCYSGENNYYNPTVTGTYPVNWRDKIKFASITSGNNQGKMCIRLGAQGSANDCEIAFTDCTHGFSGQSAAKTSGWRVIKVNDASVISSTYNGNPVTAVHRSNEFHNDEFTVYGGSTGELLTTRREKGGTILGTYQYTQYNQGLNYEHLIRSPYGHTDLTDSYCDSNWMALISASVDGTSTVDTGTTYFCQDNSDDNNSLQITNKFGYSGTGNSNRIFMVVNSGRVAWKMNHGGAYRISVTVQFLAGGKKNGTYNTADTAYQAN